jgi:HAD superfamily phosphoserine phosphatase-like hydrolase
MRVICFDFDDVIADGNPISEIARIRPEFAELKLGLELILDNQNPREFFHVIKKIVELVKGMEFDDVKRIVLGFKIMNGTRKTLLILKRYGCKIVVVSDDDKDIIKEFLEKNKLLKYVDHIYGSKLGVKDGKLTGEIFGDVIMTEKTGIVKEIEKKYRIKRKDITYVGDGLTDLPIMKIVGKGILFCPNVITRSEVFRDKILIKKEKNGELFLIEKKDLSEILRFV